MILLDKLTGTIKIDDIVFHANTTNLELDALHEKYQLSVQTTNTGTKFYTIPNIENGDISLQFLICNNKLQRINIGAGINYHFPAFTITQEEKILIKKKLENMGGENIFPWGSIEFNEDIKGGSVSVLIKYNQEQ